MPSDRATRDHLIEGWTRFQHREIDSDSLIEQYIHVARRSDDAGARNVANTIIGWYSDKSEFHPAAMTELDERLLLFLRSDADGALEQSTLLAILGLYSFPFLVALSIVFGLVDGFVYGLPFLIAAIVVPALTLPWRGEPDWPFRDENERRRWSQHLS
jgi:hypothetical protein